MGLGGANGQVRGSLSSFETPGARGTNGRLRLLDGFELTWADRPVILAPGPQRLLAFLALQARPVDRLFVAETLWADATTGRASARLRSSLWRLRRHGGLLVSAIGNRLQLGPAVEVDVRDLERRVRSLLREPAAGEIQVGDPVRATGSLLPDWGDDWVIVERERLRQLQLHALEGACRELARRGAYAQAIEAGLAAVTEEPLHETAHQALIEAYLAEGNRADALRQYAAYARIMRDDLRLDPSPAVASLVAHLRGPGG